MPTRMFNAESAKFECTSDFMENYINEHVDIILKKTEISLIIF